MSVLACGSGTTAGLIVLGMFVAVCATLVLIVWMVGR